jgi:hypothetical protein
MLLSTRFFLGLGIVATAVGGGPAMLGCSRSPLRSVEGAEEGAPVVCQKDADCRGENACQVRTCQAGLCQLVREISCDDGNPCTKNVCNPADGSCSYPWLTSDDDGDGYFAALPGKTPGAPDACGNDCNDASSLVYPGAYEACDGVDNDCNGIIDDRYRYYGPDDGLPEVIWVSDSAQFEALPGGLTYDGQNFAMTLIERNERWQGVFHAIAADGTVVVKGTPLTLAANDSGAGPLVWTGSVFGTAWEDRRETSYDIYFNRLDAYGKKLQKDLRVTSSDGFSIQPSLVYDGIEWLLAYADDQDTNSFGIYTQRIGKDAELIGEPSSVTPPYIDARQPRLTRNSNGLGLFYFSITDDRFVYQKLDANLKANGASVQLTLDQPADASIRWNGDRYVLAWATKTETTVGNTIWAMSVDAEGRTIDAPRPITSGASMARSPTVVGLGDRFVLIWADDRFTRGAFELSLQMFDSDLIALDAQQQLTAMGTDNIDPVGVLGGGSLGILFRSRLFGPWHTFFTTLHCWNLQVQ